MLHKNGKQLVWVLMLGVTVVGSNSLALSPILNTVGADLGASPVEVARANAAYGAATALSALWLGHLVDRWGAKTALIAGLLALAAAMLASAAALHWAALTAAQALAGTAAGIVLPATYALATETAPEGRGAENLGRVLTGWSVSLVVGVPLSAVVADSVSWRVSYATLVAPLLLSAWLVSRQALPARTAATPLERGYRVVLRRPAVRSLLSVCLLFMTAFYGMYAYIGDQARQVHGLSAAEAGIIVLAYGAGFGVAAFGDRLIDRFGADRLFPRVLSGVALIYAAFLPAMATYSTLLALAAAWGFANHFGLNILVLRLSEASPNGRGAVLALNSAVTYLGASLGAGLFGLLYQHAGFPALATAASALSALAALVAHGGVRAVVGGRSPLRATPPLPRGQHVDEDTGLGGVEAGGWEDRVDAS